MEREYTIDELAGAAGLPTRTVRHYQSEGLLPPPRRDGRVASYSPEHLRRLDLIAELRDRGFSLKLIRDALDDVEQGHLSLEQWLGLGEQLRHPWSDEAPAVLTEEAADKLLADRRPGLRSELVDAGLLRPGDGLPTGYVVPSPRLLEIALELDDAGVDIGTAAGAGEIIAKRLRKAAEDLVDYFAKHAGDGFGRTPADVGTVLERLRPQAIDAVRVIFAREVDRALHDRMEEVGQSLGKRARKAERRQRP
jgi:DNA-binding transcriptional MerR regulator